MFQPFSGVLGGISQAESDKSSLFPLKIPFVKGDFEQFGTLLFGRMEEDQKFFKAHPRDYLPR